ncbi:hypothetical protein [Ruminococcus champanellensis]
MYFISTLPIMARRYRIRSAKDLILILIIAAVMYGVQTLCTKKFDMEPRTARVIGIIAAMVVALILVFSFH